MARERVDNRREFLMLAHAFDAKKHTSLGGWFLSEKLDGMRAYWDGGITRGLYAHEVPWANTAKDGIRVNPPKCTGLWSRYGKPVQAPHWWLDEMPAFPMDGELYIGPQRFQDVMSACRKLDPVDAEWREVTYHAFDLPDYSQTFADGTIRNPNFEKTLTGVAGWLVSQMVCRWKPELARKRPFEAVVWLLKNEFTLPHPVVRVVEQTQLPFQTAKALEVINARLEDVVSRGGEGLMARSPVSVWEPQRSHRLVKFKPYSDAEATVRGYVWGRETDLGSKLLGVMGAMVVDFGGKRLELSGFTDTERVMVAAATHPGMPNADRFALAREAGTANPGKEADVTLFTNPQFPPGSRVTVKYRELTRDGLPKEARFFRKRPDEE